MKRDQSGRTAGVIVAAFCGLTTAAPTPLQFHDGQWIVTGTSIFDPTPDDFGDEISDDAFVLAQIIPGQTAFSGGGGTSSGPIAASMFWEGQITQTEAESTIWEMTISFSSESVNSFQPDAWGNAAVLLEFWHPIQIRINDINGKSNPVQFVETDLLDNVTILPLDGGMIIGDTLTPGLYGIQISGIFGVGAGLLSDDVIVETLVDYSLQVITSPLCPADITGDGNVDFFDVSFFLANQIDYNGDKVFNFFDVSDFLTDFAAGCP